MTPLLLTLVLTWCHGDAPRRTLGRCTLASSAKPLSAVEVTDATGPLLQLASSQFGPLAVSTAVQLGIPDVIGDGTLSAAAIAAELRCRHGEVNIDEDALERTLRLLSATGTLRQHDEGGIVSVYSLTDVGALLQSSEDTPAHQPDLACCVEYWLSPAVLSAWAALPNRILHGGGDTASAAAETSAGAQGLVTSLHGNPSYQQFVRHVSSTEIPALLDAYDWAGVGGGSGTVVDVGGGHGAVTTALGRRYPALQCVNLDVASVIAAAPPLDGNGRHAVGDMFDEATLPPCDVVLMKHVLADWADDDAIRALRACRNALVEHTARAPAEIGDADGVAGGSTDDGTGQARRTGTLLVAEVALPIGDAANGSRDVNLYVDAMLMLARNRGERTEAQWRALAAEAGFAVETIVDAASPSIDLLVLVPVDGV